MDWARDLFYFRRYSSLEAISRDYREGNVCIFVGAGVSAGCGFPLWEKLNDALFDSGHIFPKGGEYGTVDSPRGWGLLAKQRIEAIRRLLNTKPPPVKTRYIKRLLGDDYLGALQSALYAGAHNASAAVKAIASLERLHSLCTYNFDDLIEDCSNGHVRFCPVACESDHAPPGHIPIYHVHGFLPSGSDAAPRGDVIFSEDDYHRVFGNQNHWSNKIQSSLLRERTCLLIGLSCEDPNLRRLLDQVRQDKTPRKTYAVMRFPEPPMEGAVGGIFKTLTEFYDETLAGLGVEVLWVDDYTPEIEFLLGALSADNPAAAFFGMLLQHTLQVIGPSVGPKKCNQTECEKMAAKDSAQCPAHTIKYWQSRSRFPGSPVGAG